jgi:hypothetical protein
MRNRREFQENSYRFLEKKRKKLQKATSRFRHFLYSTILTRQARKRTRRRSLDGPIRRLKTPFQTVALLI